MFARIKMHQHTGTKSVQQITFNCRARMKQRTRDYSTKSQRWLASVTHQYTQYVLKEPKPHNPHWGSALLRKELRVDKPHILEHKKPCGANRIGCLGLAHQTARPDWSMFRATCLIFGWHVCARMAAQQLDDAWEWGRTASYSVGKWPAGGSGDL